MAHNIKIKSFNVEMEVKNKGVEFQVYIDDSHEGDLVIRKSGLEWCNGKTKIGNGTKVNWKDFIEWINTK